MSSAAEFDTYGWTEEELDNYLEGLGLPDANLAVITETDDAYEIRPTNDQAEFDAHCVDFAVHNEFTDHAESRPYFEALGLDFKKKLTLGTAFSLTALSNEVRLCFLRGHSFFFLSSCFKIFCVLEKFGVWCKCYFLYAVTWRSACVSNCYVVDLF